MDWYGDEKFWAPTFLLNLVIDPLRTSLVAQIIIVHCQNNGFHFEIINIVLY